MVTTQIISDAVGDMLIRMNNASMVGLDEFEVPASRERERVLAVLEKEGIISAVAHEKDHERPVFRVTITNPRRSITVRLISKPGRRLYIKHFELYQVKGGRGFLLLSTSKGVMTGTQAKEKGIGGEIIAELY